HLSFCYGGPIRSSTSMLPVSGALQLRLSKARGLLPSSVAMCFRTAYMSGQDSSDMVKLKSY
ncbi:MAG: hypothetical protein V1262_15395, partial [Alphaproteobacteria bacterium]|nr:hypothetical protein [Alphaproteobacteria bacterium]